MVKSMLGTQVSSARTSAPAYGFGSSTRAHAEKIFLSSEHAKLASKSNSPGPAVYTMRSTVGPQVDGALVSAPQWAFGSSPRFSGEVGNDKVPGPGMYEQRSALGVQASGAQPSQPIYGMGSSTRDHVQKVYISERHSTSLFSGVNSPGPASYTLQAAVGKQGASTKANQPNWVFGSNKRFQDPDLLQSAKLPSPDAYEAGSGVGPQVASTKRSAPLPGFGTSNRQHQAKLFMSPAHVRCSAWTIEHEAVCAVSSRAPVALALPLTLCRLPRAPQEKINYGKASPGPLTYLPPLNNQGRGSTFGKCDRWYTRKMALRVADTPSPCHYNV